MIGFNIKSHLYPYGRNVAQCSLEILSNLDLSDDEIATEVSSSSHKTITISTVLMIEWITTKLFLIFNLI